MASTVKDKRQSMWIRPGVDEPANVLLLGQDDIIGRGAVCQRLLTTVTPRTELVFVLEFGDTNKTWIADLDYEPANLIRISPKNDSFDTTDLYNRLSESLADRSEMVGAIVYVDSLTSLQNDSSILKISEELTQLLDTEGITGLFRADPSAFKEQELEKLSQYFEYVARYDETTDQWEM
jgi:hypothetical protein